MKKKYKVKYGKKVVAKKDIFLPKPFTNIDKGASFYLLDSYLEGDKLYVGIKQTFGIAEAGFITANPINSRMDLKKTIKNMFIEHKEGFEYKIFDDGTYIEIGNFKSGDTIKI